MTVSLYCSPTHLKVVAGSADANSVKVNDFAMYALPEGAMINGIITDGDAMVRFLSEVGAKMNILRRDALLVIDTNSIRSKVMDVPGVSEHKLLEFISRDLGAFTEEEAGDVFDYTVMRGRLENGGSRILAVAVDREILRAYRNTFSSAGFNLRNINIGVNAVNKIARVSQHLMTGARVLAIVDDRNLTLMLYENGEYKITNKYRLFNEDDTPEWRTEIGNNISSVIQFQKGQRPDETISAVYFAGLSVQQTIAIAETLAYLDIQIGSFDLSSRVRLSNKSAEKAAGFNPGKYLLNLGVMLKGKGR